MKEKTRDEIEEQYKWDLTSFFQNDEELNKELDSIKEKITEIKKYENRILDNSNNLYETLKLYVEIQSRSEKAFIYASIKWHEDLSNSHYQDMQAKVSGFDQKVSSSLAFIEPEILKGDYNQILKYIDENVSLKDFSFYLERLFRAKEHYLSKDEEEMLNDIFSITSNFDKSSNYIRDEIVDYGYIENEKGEQVKLTTTNISIYLGSPDEKVRKESYEAVNKEYKKYHSALATNYIGSLKTNVWEATKRKFNNSLEASLFDSNISTEVYNSLISAGKKGKNTYQKYLKLLSKVLGTNKLEPWNVNAKLYNEHGKNYSFEEAKDIIFDAFKIYGEEYQSILKKAFDEKWIDVFHSKNRRTGWYSWECYLVHPVVFANYNSKYIDVSALAHELGHAVQGYLSALNNKYLYSSQDPIEWEIASLTNEMVLGKTLIKKSTDKEEKKDILNSMIEVFAGNFFMTIRGSEFERDVHKILENGESLSPNKLSEIWENLVNEYNGDIVIKSEYSKYGYNKISHFYRDYYYYLYAVGVAIASYLSEEIVNGNKEVTEKYLKYLKLGGRNYSLENLKTAGIDITREDIYTKAIKAFENNLDEFEKIMTE